MRNFNALREHIASKDPIIYVVTDEEAEGISAIQAVVESFQVKHTLQVWDSVDGLRPLGVQPSGTNADPREVLGVIRDAARKPTGKPTLNVFILKDLHPYLDDVEVRRIVKTLHQDLMECLVTVILLSPLVNLPDHLDQIITVLRLPLPDRETATWILTETLENGQGRGKVVDAEIDSVMGLTAEKIALIARRSLATQGRTLNPDKMVRAKADLIREAGVLELMTPSENLADVGGHDELIAWFQRRRKAFTPEGLRFVGQHPKGCLLAGCPGVGKSLAARAIAGEWKRPLLRMDMSRIFGSLVGQSEENMRRALEMADKVAPCVLHIDEIEKAFAGARGGESDGGVGVRVFGQFLTWLAEKTSPVFVVATANNLWGLPPELLRKGRWDELWFCDLPSEEEVIDILKVHLAKRIAGGCGVRAVENHDLKALAEKMENFSGAEIEQVVVDALYLALDEGVEELKDEHLLSAAKTTVPLSKSMEDDIIILRKWAQVRARFSSSAAAARKESKVVDFTGKVERLKGLGILPIEGVGSGEN